jgi:hypothetical protein
MRTRSFSLLLLCAFPAMAQERSDLREILQRLDRLEEQNRALMEEIRSLRKQLGESWRGAAQNPPAEGGTPAVEAEQRLEERLAVEEQRTAEHEQTKVGTQQRLPVTLTGTVLFNAFLNGRSSGDQMNPTTAALVPGSGNGGASMRQTVLGMRFRGPDLGGGAHVSGSLFLDLFAGTGTSLNQLARLRVATVDVAWKNTTLSFGQDKPIVAPREPDSLAQVGVSPLTAAGNLWLWQPQFRVEQRFSFGERSGLRAQMGVYQTSESGTGVSSEYAGSLARSRPGIEGRFEWWGEYGKGRFEIAPGFHVSQTHVAAQSLASRIFSVDWMLRPFSRMDFTGQFFQGENVGVIGGLRQGVVFRREGYAHAVRAQGGWAQFTVRATPRWTFHLYGGQEDDRDSDLLSPAIAKNQIYAGNLMYRIGPNVLASFEVSQVRTTYLGSGTRLNPHYDLALAYLF